MLVLFLLFAVNSNVLVVFLNIYHLHAIRRDGLQVYVCVWLTLKSMDHWTRVCSLQWGNRYLLGGRLIL